MLRDDIGIGIGDIKNINPDAWKGMVRVPVNISLLNLSLLLAFPLYWNVDSGCCWFVVQNRIIPPQNGILLEKLSSWTEESFFPCKMTWFALWRWSSAETVGYSVCASVHLYLSSTVHETTPEGILSSCGCSLTLTLTTSIGIWHAAGATKSWSSVASLSCSGRISLCIRPNYGSVGRATRIIHFTLLVFSTVPITRIRQETISLAIRTHSFWMQIEDRLTFRDISIVAIRAKRVNLLHRQCTKPTH